MGIISDIREIVQRAKENDDIEKKGLCASLELYIEEYANKLKEKTKEYQSKNREKHLAGSAKWKKDHPEEYREQQKEYKRKMRGYYENQARKQMAEVEDKLKDNRDVKNLEVEGAKIDEKNKN